MNTNVALSNTSLTVMWDLPTSAWAQYMSLAFLESRCTLEYNRTIAGLVRPLIVAQALHKLSTKVFVGPVMSTRCATRKRASMLARETCDLPQPAGPIMAVTCDK